MTTLFKRKRGIVMRFTLNENHSILYRGTSLLKFGKAAY